ncbi:MAG: hypothetical protein KGL39_26075 [Patescibacteria group bacterium]|nr:hypothetical protein [Patescibacteria group bacterium]
MMIDAGSILQVITLGVAGWVLIELISMKTKIAEIRQKLRDLPCDECTLPRQKKSNQTKNQLTFEHEKAPVVL